MDLKKTGPLIRSLRLEQRLTQKQLAELLHLSDRTISKWERGGRSSGRRTAPGAFPDP